MLNNLLSLYWRCGSSHHCQGCKLYKRYLNWICSSQSKFHFNFIEMWINIEVNGLEEYFSIKPILIFKIWKGWRVREPHHLWFVLQRALVGCEDDVLPERQGREDVFCVLWTNISIKKADWETWTVQCQKKRTYKTILLFLFIFWKKVCKYCFSEPV